MRASSRCLSNKSPCDSSSRTVPHRGPFRVSMSSQRTSNVDCKQYSKCADNFLTMCFRSLTTFTKMLTIKSSIVTPDRPKVSLREKLLARKRDLQDISPLVLSKDGALLRKNQNSLSKTPNSKRVKTIAAEDKENVPLVCSRQSRKRSSVAIQLPRTKFHPHDEVGAKRLSILPKGTPIRRMLSTKTVSLSKEQREVLELVKSGSSLFFTGSAGTGKTFLLKRIINTLPPDSTFVTASTGIAATHIGGSTLHSFAGEL